MTTENFTALALLLLGLALCLIAFTLGIYAAEGDLLEEHRQTLTTATFAFAAGGITLIGLGWIKADRIAEQERQRKEEKRSHFRKGVAA